MSATELIQALADGKLTLAQFAELLALALRLEALIATELPARLRQLREERDWSQADLARRLGVSQSYVAGLESGRNPGVAPELRQKLAVVILRNPVADKLEELIAAGLDPVEMQHELAALLAASDESETND